MEIKKYDKYIYRKRDITRDKNKDCLVDFLGKDAATVFVLLLEKSTYNFKEDTLLPVELTPKTTNTAGITLYRLRRALRRLMEYNLVEVDLASPRIITINRESVEKFGDFFRRRVRDYNRYIRMSKEDLMKILLIKSDDNFWYPDEPIDNYNLDDEEEF